MVISEDLMSWTAEHSHFEPKRNYISMSHIADDVDTIVRKFREGYGDQDNVAGRLRCYKGYQMEADLLRRLIAVYGAQRVHTHIELIAHTGLVQGHPDFRIDGVLGDCKSVLRDDWIPKSGNLPRRVYWQMQGYMLLDQTPRCVVIYESRESGKIKDHWINANAAIQSDITAKLDHVINTLMR